MSRPLAFALALAVAASLPARAQKPSRAQLAAFVDSIGNAAIAQHKSPGFTIAVSRGSEPLLAKGFGYVDLENEIRATPAHVFRIGSITKQFTAAAIMQLVEQGKLSLDDPVTKWFPDWSLGGQKVTVTQLLNHTGGLHNYTSVPAWRPAQPIDLSHDSLLAFVRHDSLDFEPGSSWRYSNTGYYMLGVIIEKVSGQSYADYLQTHIFGPLGMTGSSYCENKPIIAHRAHGYSSDGKGGWTNASYLSMTQPYAAGSLCSTVADLVTWTKALESGKVVKPESYAKMTTPIALTGGKPNRYGFGLGVGELNGHPFIGHNGGINGFTSQKASYPHDSLIVVVLTNTEATLPMTLEKKISQRALGIVAPPVKDLALSDAESKRYVGTYVLQGQDVVVKMDGGHLAVLLGGPPMRLLNQGDGAFVNADDEDFKLRFVGTGAQAERIEATNEGQKMTLTRKS
jgi:CubicO group peptidase (beta-lactamase class C family)